MRTSEFSPRRGIRMSNGLRLRGTTLVEMLVVIVIFLVGILAVVQIFPGGFRLLIQARKQAVAAALARSESERLTSSPNGIPEMILPTAAAEANNPSPSNLSPAGASIDVNGNLFTSGNVNLGHWAFNTGANLFRRIEGEHHRMPAPRKIGLASDDYGCAFLPSFGFLEGGYAQVSGNLLATDTRVPDDLTNVGPDLYTTATTFGDFTALVQDSATPVTYVPTGSQDRMYRFTLDVYVLRGGATIAKTLRSIAAPVGATTKGPNDPEYPLYAINLNSLATSALDAGESLVSVDSSSMRIRRAYRQVAAFSSDPFEYRMIQSGRGLLLFNPNAAAASVSTGAGRSPLEVVVSYTTADWRILRQDMRLNNSDGGQYKLPLGSLKTDDSPSPDGKNQSALVLPVSDTAYQADSVSHLVVIDLETGSVVAEKRIDNTPLMRVDKSQGIVQFIDADTSTEDMDVLLVLPTGGTKQVSLSGRAMRVLYEAKEEWSVQVLRAAANYTPAAVLPVFGRYYVGGSNPAVGGVSTRIYFPAEDVGQSVTVAKIAYVRADASLGQLSSQRFTIRYRTGDTVNLPSIDVRDVAVDAAGFDSGAAPSIDGISGSSLQVRTLWNPDFVSLTTDPVQNMTRVNNWGQAWRKRITQVFIDREDEN